MPEIQVNKQIGASEPFFLRHHATTDGVYKGRQLPGFPKKD
jgi:RecJ-like exonuclease